ncbi:MAG: tetratricopeptide repeat protein [Candidatus Odinarchaeota archaeon]
MAIVIVLAFIIIAALISLSIGWLFNKFRIFKVNYLVQAEGEPVEDDRISHHSLGEFRERYRFLLSLIPPVSAGWAVFGILLTILTFYRDVLAASESEAAIFPALLQVWLLASASVLAIVPVSLILKRIDLPEALGEAIRSRFSVLILLVILTGITVATVTLSLQPVSIILLVLLIIPCTISSWYAGEFYAIFTIRQFYASRGWDYIKGKGVRQGIKGKISRLIGFILFLLALAAPVLAINSLWGVLTRTTESGGLIGTLMSEVLSFPGWLALFFHVLVFALILGPLITIATQPTGFLELTLNSNIYSTLSNFDWEDFNRKSAKMKDIINVRPYKTRVMAGVLAIYVSFIMYVAIISFGGLVASLALPVGDLGLEKLQEALKLVEVPVLLLVISHVLIDLRAEREVMDIANLSLKEQRDVTGWTFWVLQHLYQNDYEIINNNLDELLADPVTKADHRAHFYKGLTLALEGDNAGAETYFRRSADLNPKYSDAWMELGIVQYFQGKREEALVSLQEAAKYKNWYLVYFNLGRTYDILGRIDEAREFYLKALKKNSKDFKSWANLTAIYVKLGQLDEAITAGERALELEPGDHIAKINLSIAYQKAKRTIESKKIVDELLTSHGSNVTVLEHLAVGRMLENDYQGAVELYGRIVELEGVSAFNLPDLSVAYDKLGRGAEAVQVVEKYLAVNPDDLKVRFLLGEIFIHLNQFEQAINQFEIISERDKSYETVLLKLASSYGRLQRFEEALDTLLEAKDILSDNADVHYNLGLTKAMLGRTDFDDDFNRSLQLEFNPQFLSIWLQARAKANTLNDEWIGQVTQDLGRKIPLKQVYAAIAGGFGVLGDNERARSYYQKALEEDPDAIEILKQAGLFNLQQQNFEEARNIYKKLVELEQAVESYANLGVALLRLGKVEEALQSFIEGHQLYPEDQITLGNIAMVYAQTKRYAEAVPYYEKLVKLVPGDYQTRTSYARCLALINQPEMALEQLNTALEQARRSGDEAAVVSINELLGYLQQES